jgi:hypothetical protein
MWSWETDPDDALIQGYLLLAKRGVTMLAPTVAEFPEECDRPFPVSRFCRAKCLAAKILDAKLDVYVVAPVSRAQLDEIRTDLERIETQWLRDQMKVIDEELKALKERKKRRDAGRDNA